MRTFSKIIVALGLVLGSTACKSDEDKKAERVENARERVAEKTDDLRDQQEDVREEQEDVTEAKAELMQARADLVMAFDKQLQTIDDKITMAKANAGFDATRVVQLRAEAAALRAQAADANRTFSVETERANFDRIVNDIDGELTRK